LLRFYRSFSFIGKLTKWIVIGIIIFFVVTAVVVPCVLLLGPDDPEILLSTTVNPGEITEKAGKVIRIVIFSYFLNQSVRMRSKSNYVSMFSEFFIKDSIIFKAIENNIKSASR
jgi:hypothetical protein